MKQMINKMLVPGLLALLCCAQVSAQTAAPAADQKIVKQILSNGGVKGKSITFTEVGTFGETFVGVGQSATFTVSQGFWNSDKAASCCVGLVGNIDCDPSENVDIIDLTRLIDYMFISFDPLCCDAEGYFGEALTGVPVTTTYRPDIAALTAMIDYLFVTFAALPECAQ